MGIAVSFDDDPHAILGLEPDADVAAIERAYRILIKRYHPDRPSGDSDKAAALNRAYRTLRADRVQSEVSFRQPMLPPRRHWQMLWPGALGALALLTVAAVLMIEHLPVSRAQVGGAKGGTNIRSARALDEPMRAPLDESAIVDAVHDAVSLSRSSDETGLSAWSDFCQQNFRDQPTVRQFDRCAAFDSAAIRLLDHDPLRDRGPFSQLAVTGRTWGAADALSDDNQATEGRIKAIQARVRALVITPFEA